MTPEQLEKLRQQHAYFDMMYKNFAGNPSAQNAIVEQTFSAFNPQALQQQTQQEQFMQQLMGGGQAQQAQPVPQFADQGYYRGPNNQITMGSQLNQMYANGGNIAGMNNIDPNAAIFEIDDGQTTSQTGDAIGNISKAVAPGVGGFQGSNITNPGSWIKSFTPEPIRQGAAWSNQAPWLQQNLGDLYSGIKNTPFTNDLVRRVGDVFNTTGGIKVLPGYTTN